MGRAGWRCTVNGVKMTPGQKPPSKVDISRGFDYCRCGLSRFEELKGGSKSFREETPPFLRSAGGCIRTLSRGMSTLWKQFRIIKIEGESSWLCERLGTGMRKILGTMKKLGRGKYSPIGSKSLDSSLKLSSQRVCYALRLRQMRPIPSLSSQKSERMSEQSNFSSAST